MVKNEEQIHETDNCGKLLRSKRQEQPAEFGTQLQLRIAGRGPITYC